MKSASTLRLARLGCGLRLDDVAAAAGGARVTVWCVECGSPASAETGAKVAAALARLTDPQTRKTEKE